MEGNWRLLVAQAIVIVREPREKNECLVVFSPFRSLDRVSLPLSPSPFVPLKSLGSTLADAWVKFIGGGPPGVS